ncbi:Eco57I restriction-modification methylase domain-containing protein, partial [Rubritalea tangerina]
MNKQEAETISQDTFSGGFDETQFTAFISNLFKDYERRNNEVRGNYIKEAFKPFVSHYKRIGKYIDAEGNVIDTIIVHLKRGSSLERARTAQRNFVAEYLKTRDKDAALVAFLSPDSSDWRLSLVKFETSFHHDEEKGKLKMVSETTPAKRWSFLIGENEGKHTVTSRFLDFLQSDVSPNLAELEAAFDVETVSKEFFEKYKELFFKMKDALDALIEGDESIKQDFEAKEISTANFAEKTMGQLSFLYFLQKKGWFGVKPNEAWGTGSKGFLKELFKDRHKYPVHHELGTNFFDDILEPLFYSALAQDRGEAAMYDRLNCRMPFLNGGLFEPMHDYSWETTHVRLPDDLFSNENKTKDGDTGDGILDVFDRYNFTVNESEPLEKEVAVDPEMLGKVFERIVARKQNDKFYTPRPIVHYMSQQCLIQYLSDSFRTQTQVSHSDFEFLILHGSRIIENDRIFFEKQEQIKRGEIKSTDYKLLMPGALSALAEEVDTALANIKVCDPAVGSGAFPLGMLNEIVQARAALAVHKKVPIDYYELKKHTILHSIYGVDLDGGAVEIAKLRLWLSLVVEEDEPHPLPNLEFKIAQGNSLLSKYEGITLFDETILETSEHLKERLSTVKAKIKNVQSQINAIELSDGHSSQRSNEDKLSLEHLKRQLAMRVHLRSCSLSISDLRLLRSI